MTDFIFKSRFGYRRHYIPKGHQKLRWVDLNDECDVTVSDVEPDAAPVAYKISLLDKSPESHEIRSYAGSLWWPVYGASGPLRASDFRALTETNWDIASAILDPLHRTYRFHGVNEHEFFKGLEIRENKGQSTFEQQFASAHRDASRMLFCKGHVLVEGGDPVWYFVPRKDARDGVDLVAGPSSLDRREAAGYFTPGPDRHVRLASAWRGHAFGLAEIEAAKEIWTEHEPAIHVKSEIVARIDRPAASAADLCSRALAEHLWDIAWMHPDLRKAMPAVAKASHPNPAPETLPYREMLQQLISLEDYYLRRNLSHLIGHAHEILGRLASVDCLPLTEEDDAALAALGV
jgi:hypothetical protein